MSSELDKRIQQERIAFAYMARYGQHPETEAVYRDAIQACRSVDALELTISEIARMYQLKPECLRNQLKRHFPEIISRREQMREMMGVSRPGNRGLKKATIEKYASAIELLRQTQLTIREVAERCEVSYYGLQQHLLFYHKDIADARMLARVDALLKPLVVGGNTAKGGIRVPRPDAVAQYGPAVEMFKTSRLSIVEIAKRCGVKSHNLSCYLRRWHNDLLMLRREQLAKEREAKKKEPKTERSKSALARQKYLPSVEMIEAGYSVSETANRMNVDVENLRSWLKFNFPEVLKSQQYGMMRLSSGRMAKQKTYNKYTPIAAFIKNHPDMPTKLIAEQWNVPVSSLGKKMRHYFPEIWDLHCKQCALKKNRT